MFVVQLQINHESLPKEREILSECVALLHDGGGGGTDPFDYYQIK